MSCRCTGCTNEKLTQLALENEKLRADLEESRQAMARLSAPGIKHAPWFYSPCPTCGEIEGMGLTTPEIDGVRMSGYTSVWCCHCGHFGPSIKQEIGKVEENDRVATLAWNAQFRAAWIRYGELSADLKRAEEVRDLAREASNRDLMEKRSAETELRRLSWWMRNNGHGYVLDAIRPIVNEHYREQGGPMPLKLREALKGGE